MSYTISINNGSNIAIKDGAVYTDVLGETLDSGVFVFTNVGKINIKDFQTLIFAGTNIETKTQLVDAYLYDVSSYGNTNEFKYQVNTFSETKELERITLPSVSITQSLDSSVEPIKVYDEIYRFVSEYSPKIRVYSSLGQWEWKAKFTIDQKVYDKFSTIDCPEMQWDKPTLREVLNDLFLVADCIVVLKGNVISYYDLTIRGHELNESIFKTETGSSGSQDAIGELTLNLQQAIGKKTTRVIEYVGFRNSSEGILTTSNVQLETSKPIYSIKKITYCGSLPFRLGGGIGQSGVDSWVYSEVDITRRVMEYDAYKLLKKEYLITQYWYELPPANPIYKEYIQFNIYYTRGTKIISGFVPQDLQILIPLNNQFCSVLASTFEDERRRADLVYTFNFEGYFKIEYETLNDVCVNVGKTNEQDFFNNRVFNQQSNSFVDLSNEGIFEYLKINRLGNEIHKRYGTFASESELPKLGDTLNDEVLFQREISYFDAEIKLVAYFTKNYILQNYFTAVKSKKRSWQIMSSKDALTKLDNIKYYCELSFERRYETLSYQIDSQIAYNLACACQTNSGDFSLKTLVLYTEKGTDRFPTLDTSQAFKWGFGYQSDLSNEIFGNSIILTFNLQDNYSVGTRLSIVDNYSVNTILPYCDSNANFDKMVIRFCNYLDAADGEFIWSTFTANDNSSTISTNRRNKSYQKPLVSAFVGEYRLEIENNHKKDNREIIALTTQLEFCTDTKNIIFTKKFLENQPLYNNVKPEITLHVDNDTITQEIYGEDINDVYPAQIINAANIQIHDYYEDNYILESFYPNQTFFTAYYHMFKDLSGNYYLMHAIKSTDGQEVIYTWDESEKLYINADGSVFGLTTLFIGSVLYGWNDVDDNRSKTQFGREVPLYFHNFQWKRYLPKFKIYTSTTETYPNTNVLSPKGNVSAIQYQVQHLSTTSAILQLQSNLSSNIKSWALVNDNDEVILAVNSNTNYVYFNILQERDERVFSKNNTSVPIGNIKQTTFVDNVPLRGAIKILNEEIAHQIEIEIS